MSEFRYASDDGKFKVSLPHEQLNQMLSYCQAAQGKETGGILAGYYVPTHDCAVVTVVSGPPSDSRASRTRFQRGVEGMKQWLQRLWKHSQRRYYLGEWHFHPFAAPNPSEADCAQMQEISDSLDYHCPEPLLVIVGGDPLRDWRLSMHLFVRNEPSQSVLLQPENLDKVKDAHPSAERKHNA